MSAIAGHKAKAVKAGLVDCWIGSCSCGWEGPMRGIIPGARGDAVADYYQHLDTVDGVV